MHSFFWCYADPSAAPCFNLRSEHCELSVSWAHQKVYDIEFLYFHSGICIGSFFLLVNLLCILFSLHGSVSPCYIQIFYIQFILDMLKSCSSFSLLSSNLFCPVPKFTILCLLVDYLQSQGFHSQPVPLLYTSPL